MEPTDLADHLSEFIRRVVDDQLARAGGVVGVSGGIDSAVTLALTIKALGVSRTRAVLMPERESSLVSTQLGQALCAHFGVEHEIRDITRALDGLGCYTDRDAAVSDIIPEYDPGDELKVVLHQNFRRSRLPARYSVEVTKADGSQFSGRPTIESYRRIFAAANYKQRLRTVTLYNVAELRNLAVVGTSNLDETYLGFFVKIGDDTWDVGPLSNVSKRDVRKLAEVLDVPREIRDRPTTTDTFPVEEQSQEEMFYSISFDELDVVLECVLAGLSVDDAATELGWTTEEVENAVANVRRRHRSTEWNRLRGITL